MLFEHEHIERIGRTTRQHIVEYLCRNLRKDGQFLFPDEETHSSLTNAHILNTLKVRALGGQVFLVGSRIAGFALRKKERTHEGKEWRVMKVCVDAVFAKNEDHFDRVLDHIGKILFEEAWVNNASSVRFEDGGERHQMLLIDRAVRGRLPLHLTVKFHPGGDMSRLVIAKTRVDI